VVEIDNVSASNITFLLDDGDIIIFGQSKYTYLYRCVFNSKDLNGLVEETTYIMNHSQNLYISDISIIVASTFTDSNVFENNGIIIGSGFFSISDKNHNGKDFIVSTNYGVVIGIDMNCGSNTGVFNHSNDLQADWRETDPDSRAYINNKPSYTQYKILIVNGNTGNDSNDGFNNPLKTLDKAIDLIELDPTCYGGKIYLEFIDDNYNYLLTVHDNPQPVKDYFITGYFN
jgi:hypothetical protein